MERMKKDDVVRLFLNIKEIMNANRQVLIELDGKIGDADLGLTMTHGFDAAYEEVQAASASEGDLGKLLAKGGMAMAKKAPSTMGTLMATGFLRGGKAVMGKTELGPEEISLFFKAFHDGIVERGQAKLGDKTVVDTLKPTSEAVDQAVKDGFQLIEVLKKGFEASKQGLESTKGMMAQHGKAAVFREKTLGLVDPGSQAFVYVMEGFAKTLS